MGKNIPTCFRFVDISQLSVSVEIQVTSLVTSDLWNWVAISTCELTGCQAPHLKVITPILFLYGIFQCSVLVSSISYGRFSCLLIFWEFFWTAGIAYLSNLQNFINRPRHKQVNANLYWKEFLDYFKNIPYMRPL